MRGGKIGIALGGGAARGWAHIGVLKSLMAEGIAPDVVVGTSIGAVAGGCFVAGRIDELDAFARSLTRRRVFNLLDFNLTGSGLITGRRLCDHLNVHLAKLQIDELDKPFVAVATEVGVGHEVWLNRGRLVDALRASYAIPGIFRPVQINGRWLMDGALVNPIPVSVCRALGADTVIAVNLHCDTFGKGTVIPHEGAVDAEDVPADPEAEQHGEQHRSARHLLHRQFFGRGGEGAPGISTVMMDAFNIIHNRVARSRLAGDPPDLIIRPRLGGIGLFEFYRARELIAAGEAAVAHRIDDIRAMVGAAAA